MNNATRRIWVVLGMGPWEGGAGTSEAKGKAGAAWETGVREVDWGQPQEESGEKDVPGGWVMMMKVT